MVERVQRSAETAGEKNLVVLSCREKAQQGDWEAGSEGSEILNLPCTQEAPVLMRLLCRVLEVRGSLLRWPKLWSALRKNSLGNRNKRIPALLMLTCRSQE